MEHKLFLRIAAIMLTIFFFAGCGKKPMPSVANTAPSTAEPTPVPTEPMPTAPVIDQAACYEAAWAAVEAGDLPLAYRMFTLAGDYGDAKACLERFVIKIETRVSKCDGTKDPDIPNGEGVSWSYGYKEEHVYDELGRPVYGSTVILKSVADGSLVDSDQKKESAWEYDDQGRLLVKTSGTSRTTYIYDEQGRVVEENRDSYRTIYAYDEHGNKTLEKAVRPDGGTDWEYRWEYTYYPSGTLQKFAKAEKSYMIGGYITNEQISTYNEAGNETEQWRKTQNHYDGYWLTLEQTTTWEYDDAGREILKRTVEAEGITTETISEYDDRGLLIRQFTTGYNYTTELTKAYDEEGREVLVRKEKISDPAGNNDHWEQTATVYDANGNILSRTKEICYPNKSKEDRTESEAYVYNEAGLIVERREEKTYRDPQSQQKEGWSLLVRCEYDGAGQLLRQETDYREGGDPAANGSYVEVVCYGYDVWGHVVREETENSVFQDGEKHTNTRESTWEYDEEGFLTVRSYTDIDGSWGTWKYDCAGNELSGWNEGPNGVQSIEFTYVWFFLPEAATP